MRLRTHSYASSRSLHHPVMVSPPTSPTMTAPPPNTRHQSISGRVRNLANFAKPHVDIRVGSDENAATSSWIHSFSTRDRIKGTVNITAPVDTRIDDIEISFVGQMKTLVEKIGATAAATGKTEAFSQFLQLRQPIRESQYPPNHMFEAGKVYSFPYTFVIPDHLLHGSSCRHKVANAQVRDAHLQLPPSLGDPDMSGHGNALLDDFAPDMAKISYAIQCNLKRNRERDGKEQPLVTRQKKVRVIPAHPELPPLSVDGKDGEYCIRAEKGIRKGMFKGRSGRLVVEAPQPPSINLPPPNDPDAPPATTMATILLRFDPSDEHVETPRLNSLSSKLKIATFYASAGRKNVPTKGSLMYDVTQSVHVDSLSLSQRCVQSVQWQKHDPTSVSYDAQALRRDSTTSVSSPTAIAAPSSRWSEDGNKPFYTATIVVPIALPKTKAWVPTFHSCLISRIYILELSLGVPNAGAGTGVGSSVTLKVPLQLSSTSASANAALPDPEPLSAEELAEEARAAAEAEASVDEFFRTRSTEAPSPEYNLHDTPMSLGAWASREGRHYSVPNMENPSLAPPGYSYNAPRGSVIGMALPAYG